MFKKPKIIVVGSGISGLMTAIQSAKNGAEVTLFSSSAPRRSSSILMSEGVNAVLNTDEDSIDNHVDDTFKAGGELADKDLIGKMCSAAPKIVSYLDRLGVMFTRTNEGLLDRRQLATSSKRRTVYAGLKTGHHILSQLDNQVRKFIKDENVRLFDGFEFLSLIIDDSGVCRGIVVINEKNMELKTFAADAVVMCAGGFSGIFGVKSTNKNSDGNAIARCLEQGVIVANPEFIEFHPITIPLANKSVPISEVLLSYGAQLSVPREGKDWHFLTETGSSKNLPSRTQLCRAIWKVTKEMGLGVDGENCIHLDLSECEPSWLMRNIPEKLNICASLYGDDPLSGHIKVTSACHETLGGLSVDSNHATNIHGLFAAGRCSSIYHGAESLAGNEILASLYGGKIAADGAYEYVEGAKVHSDNISSSCLDQAKAREEERNMKLSQIEGEENYHTIRLELGEKLFDGVNFIKDNASLKKCADEINTLKERANRAPLLDGSSWGNSELLSMRRLGNNLLLADLVVESSIRRDESRGVHIKKEFTNRDDKKFGGFTKVKWSKDGFKFID